MSRSTAILAPMDGEPLAAFIGRVDCRFDGCGPLGLILSGHTAQRPQEALQLSFAGKAPEDFPRTLENASVQRLSEGHYRIASGAGVWAISARAAHLHRQVAAAFYLALPPPPPRWTRRLFWRIVLALAATSAGRWLLRVVRGG